MKHFYDLSPALIALGALALLPVVARATNVSVTNLVTDDQAANAAQTTDPELVNAWGVSYSPTGPFWVSDNGTGLSTLYRVDPTTNATSKLSLVVSIPGDGAVTGQVFNSTPQFNGDPFLFASEDGTISGWRGALGTTAETLQAASTTNAYKGTAFADIGGNAYLYAANFATGTIDVLKGSGAAPALSGSFTDPTLPAAFAPFNVQNLGGTLFATYAVVGPTGDDVAGAGNGIVDAFDLQGNFVRRIATGAVLDSPWGLAIAPSSFGALAGDLLVGNFGDGKINAFDLSTDSLAGPLTGMDDNPIVIDGLWALIPGNGAMAGDSNSIYFTAGPNEESHGLFGVITAVPEPGTALLVTTGVLGLAASRRRRAN